MYLPCLSLDALDLLRAEPGDLTACAYYNVNGITPLTVTQDGTADAEHLTQPSETGAGAARAMQGALADAELNPQDIDYINAHGTGTPLGDISETKAIRTVFGPTANKVAVSSTKSAIGHLLGASGGAEIIATIMGLRNSVAPPTLNLDQPDAQCDLDYVPKEARDMPIRRAMSNSFGFGGHNACLIVARFE